MDYLIDLCFGWPADFEGAVAEMSLNEHKHWLIVGMGATGFSVARFLSHHNIPFAVADETLQEEAESRFRHAFPQVGIKTGHRWRRKDFSNVECVVVSPGVPLDRPIVRTAIESACFIASDIELFAQFVQPGCRIVGITGTNGKSTVTCLLADMAQRAGLRVAKGGNLSPPALDLLLDMPDADLYVLELSSFQLEMTNTLSLSAATILNISQDHLDRYDSLREYIRAKRKIYRNAQQVIFKRAERLVGNIDLPCGTISFGLDQGAAGQFGLIQHQGEEWIACGETPWIACASLPCLEGEIGQLNAQAALALGTALELPQQAMLQALPAFKSLPHRMERFGCAQDVEWINDSKATNVAAATAAIGMVTKPCIWIAGGDGKGADFEPLAKAIKKNIRAILLFGKSAQCMANTLLQYIPESMVEIVSDLGKAAQQAMALANKGDCILLAPACSSLDQYSNYEARGKHFRQLFEEFQCTTG